MGRRRHNAPTARRSNRQSNASVGSPAVAETPTKRTARLRTGGNMFRGKGYTSGRSTGPSVDDGPGSGDSSLLDINSDNDITLGKPGQRQGDASRDMTDAEYNRDYDIAMATNDHHGAVAPALSDGNTSAQQATPLTAPPGDYIKTRRRAGRPSLSSLRPALANPGQQSSAGLAPGTGSVLTVAVAPSPATEDVSAEVSSICCLPTQSSTDG